MGVVRSRIDRYAKASLLIALGLAILGALIRWTGGTPFWDFWGGLIFTLGEAALVGGLADWFAVRALFEKPLGIPFHTAIIPKNRERIVKQIRYLVQDESPLRRIIDEELADLERRLREEPEFRQKVQDLAALVMDADSLGALLGPVVASLHIQLLNELQQKDSKIANWSTDRLQRWVEELARAPESRAQVNAWCRHIVIDLVEKHHSLIGTLVEEQLNRLSNEKLVEMIEEKAGDDLNWIRINGAIVGGLVGVVIYLVYYLAGTWLATVPGLNPVTR